MLITSFANPTVKRYRALAARKTRRAQAAFTVEGLQPVWRAVAAAGRENSPWSIDTLLIAPELLAHDAALAMVAEAERAGTAVARVDRAVFAHLSDRDGPAGLAAIVSGAVPPIAGFRPAASGPVIALHRVGNPGNIGTILRSADAAGASGLLVVGPSADPLAPAAVKASMGSLFALPIARADDDEQLFAWADGAERPVVAVTGNCPDSLWRTEISPQAVLLFGSEGDGLPDELAHRCAAAVAIPMTGTAESLNLATAASVTLFELARRRADQDRVINR